MKSKENIRDLISNYNKSVNHMDLQSSDIIPFEIFTIVTDTICKDIEPGRYYISNYGRIYDYANKKFVKITMPKNNDTYPKCTIYTKYHNEKSLNIHRALLLAFNYSDDVIARKLVVNHKDTMKSNYSLPNLEWCTTSENAIHARDNGCLHPCHGVNHPHSNIDDVTCRKICALLEENILRQKDIAEKFNIPVYVVDCIKHGKSWKDISKDYKIRNVYDRKSRIFTYYELCDCCKYFETHPKDKNVSLRSYLKEMFNHFGFEASESKLNLIRGLYNKKRWDYIYRDYKY